MQHTADNNIMVIKFADSKVPTAKITLGKDFISFGEKNDYPDYLLHLYNKSSKHNAIINGKAQYILGKGVANDLPIANQRAESVNSWGESLNEIIFKCILDIEIFGGYYIKVVYNPAGLIAELYHIPFQNIRVGKDGGYFYREDWDDRFARTKPVIYAAYTPGVVSKEPQIFCFKEYRPGTRYYPLPGYMGSINYIETDIRISQYHLSAINNGMFPSKMIQFFNGEPNEEGKKKLERQFKDKFTGAENAGEIILSFGNDPAKAIQIQDLSATELDKQFTILNETVQQEVFSGHGITTPALFGVMTAGKLGESTQLKEGFEIFKNTYVTVKQGRLMEGINYLTKAMGIVSAFTLQDVDPIGFTLSEAALLQVLTKDELRVMAGHESLTQEPIPGAVPATETMVNENIKNLTGRQWQNIARIARKFAKGDITHTQAILMLQNGYGLSTEEAETYLTGGEDV